MIGVVASGRLIAWSAESERPASSDGDAVRLARQGVPSAFDALVTRYQGRIFNLAYRLLRNREDAEDITQEAFLRAFRALPRLRDEGAFVHWLGRIAANLCASHLRSRGRRSEVVTDPLLLGDDPAAPGPTTTEEAQAVAHALVRLPAKHRLALTAFYLEGRSYQEAARLLGVPVATLKTRLYRGRRQLRDLLRGESQP
jgi:RNA polymerase sigma-70 factor, ECF subfamily